VLLLPRVRHLVHQHRRDPFVVAADKGIRVEYQLMFAERDIAASETIGREIPGRVGMPLVGDEQVTKRAREQHRIEVIVGLLQAAIFDRRDRLGLIHFLFVRSTRTSTLSHVAVSIGWGCGEAYPQYRVRQEKRGRQPYPENRNTTEGPKPPYRIFPFRLRRRFSGYGWNSSLKHNTR